MILYYEETDAEKAAFGKKLTWEQWEEISEVKAVYVDVLFTAPLIVVNAAHPLLQELRSEMTTEGRAFSFLCGHDSNLSSVLAALDVSDYELPDAIEKKTPIGSKLVFSKWKADNGDNYWSADLVYQTADQMRTMSLLDLKNPPVVFHISLNGLVKNPEELYTEADFLGRFDRAIEAYYDLIDNFSDSDVLEPVLPELCMPMQNKLIEGSNLR